MMQQVLAVVAPIFICGLIGVGWRLCRLHYPSDFVGLIVMNIAGPCLTLNSLVSTSIDLGAMADIALIGLLMMVITFLIWWLVLRLLGYSVATYMPPLLFPNTGNMGLPVCLFAFGDPGLALALGYYLFMMLAQFTLGVVLVQGGRQSISGSLVSLLKQPMVHAMLLGFFLVLNDYSLPLWVANTVGLVGDLTIPLMLITLGASLVGLKVGRWWRAVWLSVGRQLVSLAVAFAVCAFMGVSGLLKGVVLLEAVMPAAVFNYLFALRYAQAPDEVAGVVVVSTLLSLVLLPFFVAYVL